MSEKRTWLATLLLDQCMRIRCSLAAKMLLATATVAISTFTLSSFVSYYREHAAMQEHAMHEQIQTGMLIARQISEWFQGRELLVELTGDILTHEGDIREQISAVRQKTIIKSFEETYFGSSSGQMITSSPDNELPSDYDPRKRPWYTSAVRLNRTVLTEPYRSAGTHGQVVTMAVPLYRNGQLRGVTGSDFRIDTVVTSMRQLETQGSGYAFLVNAKGMILVHPDNEWVGQSVAHLFSNQRITLTRAISLSRLVNRSNM